MNASRPALPEPTLAAWSRTARPIRLGSPAVPSPNQGPIGGRAHDDDADQVDDLLFGCSAAVLMAMPVILLVATVVR